MQTIKLLINYEGTHYFGWQKQTETKKTIQGIVEEALEKLCHQKISLIGSGRTDAGTHAKGQIAHFRIDELNPRLNLLMALNANLPKDISVKKAWLMPNEFHAKGSVIKKTYRYQIHNSKTPPALYHQYLNWVARPIDINRLNELTKKLIGVHDFKAFQNAGTDVAHTIREIYEAKWQNIENTSNIEFIVTGNGFLKQMVRNIVGTALDLYFEGQGPNKMSQILDSKDRTKAGKTASAEGLFLEEVIYPENLDRKGQEL